MNTWLLRLSEFAAGEQVLSGLKAVVLVLVGFVVAKITVRSAEKMMAGHLAVHEKLLVRRAVFYGIFLLFIFSALHQLGFDLGVLLGAAGIFSVAIGFASQTSASNLISGLFLLGERPFAVGDVIKVSEITGEVLAVDLLSVKLRTFDNLYVRIPNETMIKSEVTTLTKFPIRRIDLQLGIAYKEDIGRVRTVLLRLAEVNLLCLEEPKPLFIFKGFGDSSLDIQFSVWARRENFLDLRNSIYEEIKLAFDANGIEIPFPHLSLYAGSVTDPFPVTMVDVQGRTNARGIGTSTSD